MTPGLSVWVDESEKSEMLAVGGVLCEWSKVPSIVAEWRRMKTTLSLSPDAEVKWNLPQKHATRVELQKAGRTTKELCEEAVRTICSQALVCVVVVMFEKRRLEWWKTFWPKVSVRDFYCEALKYLLQRVAEEVAEQKATSCAVICDKPELGKKAYIYKSIRRGAGAVEKAYASWYVKGVNVGPGWQKHGGCLAEINFHPSVLTGDATYHDMLQIADVVVGLTRDWVDTVRREKNDPWILQQMKTLSRSFRKRYGNPDFFGDGLVLWPCQNELWDRLQSSLR